MNLAPDWLNERFKYTWIGQDIWTVGYISTFNFKISCTLFIMWNVGYNVTQAQIQTQCTEHIWAKQDSVCIKWTGYPNMNILSSLTEPLDFLNKIIYFEEQWSPYKTPNDNLVIWLFFFFFHTRTSVRLSLVWNPLFSLKYILFIQSCTIFCSAALKWRVWDFHLWLNYPFKTNSNQMHVL